MAGLAAVTVDPVSATGACMGALELSPHKLACSACQDLSSRWLFWNLPRAFEGLMCCHRAVQAECCVVHELGLLEDSGVRRACGDAIQGFIDTPAVLLTPALVRLL